MSELVNTEDGENTSVGNQVLIWVDLITGQVSVSNELLTWLVDAKGLWELLSSEVHSERVSSVVGVVDFSNFNGIIG